MLLSLLHQQPQSHTTQAFQFPLLSRPSFSLSLSLLSISISPSLSPSISPSLSLSLSLSLSPSLSLHQSLSLSFLRLSPLFHWGFQAGTYLITANTRCASPFKTHSDK